MQMAILLIIVIILSSLLLCQWWIKNRNSPPITTWPIVGMLPGILHHSYHIHDFAAHVLNQCGGTLEFKGPLFSHLNFLVTCDPINVNHILSRNFANYEKGSEFREIFEPLGDGILNVDSGSWKNQRRMLQSLMMNKKFEAPLMKTIQRKAVQGLIPILDHISQHGIEVDLQDLFQRFNFDNICSLVLGFDPNFLSVEFPKVEFASAIADMEEAIVYRHVVPLSLWKLQKWLQIGQERKMSRAWESVDRFIYQCISSKREKLQKMQALDHKEEEKQDLLTTFLADEELSKSNKLIRDYAFSLVTAGRDTVSAGLSWFFWLVATNPSVKSKIWDEINSKFPKKAHDQPLDKKGLDQMIYLHAALCETLRLYPSVPINHKCTIQADSLPSGHLLHPNTRVLISFYSMGRMKQIWGEDCLQFKPERWISSEQGVKSIIHIPSHKFTAFNAGPRTCIGKDMSFIEMKIVAIMVLQDYHVQVVEEHPVSPSNSVLLHMKNGLQVRITKRGI